MQSSTYIHSNLAYFFSQSQLIDLEIGRQLQLNMSSCLSIFEEAKPNKIKLLHASLKVLGLIFQKQGYFVSNSSNLNHFLESDGLKIALFCFQNYLNLIFTFPLNEITIIDEMIIKNLLNIIYSCLFEWYNMAKMKQEKQFLTQITNFFDDLQIDSMMIKMITLTLEVHYLPIKKIAILYTRILSFMFNNVNIYEDSELLLLGKENQLSQDYLSNLKSKQSQQSVKENKSPVEKFYAKHNSGDCPLAQSIVVGLLRSLLTICNSQAHKKFVLRPQKGSGVDSYREWQITYQFIIKNQDYMKYLSQKSQKAFKSYVTYNETSDPEIPTHYEFYSHKIYTTSVISVFFSFLLISFKKNIFIQYTYLFQLISDANGILVFLKFLTDKFEFLQPNEFQKKNLRFQDEVMLTVFSVLSVLFGACNNYTEKTKSYLFQYNSYLIIKKIPHLFMQSHKYDDELPSQKQIKEEFDRDALKQPLKLKVKQLTELCYDLLKIQIPFFSKKVKQSNNNMKMIVDIYCQLPKHIEPIKRTEIQKLYLKTKFHKTQAQKYIRSIEELKTVHNDYNNYYYWANDFVKSEKEIINKKQAPEKAEMSHESLKAWLEENVWRYYD